MQIGQTIKNKKTGKTFLVVGFEGCNIVLKDKSGRKFQQAMFAVNRDYEVAQ